MKTTRTGLRKDKGTDILFNVNIVKLQADKHMAPKWSQETHEVAFNATGGDRGNDYIYRITFPLSELLALLESSVPTVLVDPASKAVCGGAIASLQQLLLPPVTPTK